MFTVEQRNALRDRVLQLASDDDRVVAGAVVGSLAVSDGGDRYSDLDLTFAVAGDVPVLAVLDDFTRILCADLGAVHLVDLPREPTIYRVLLFPDALQLDLSMTPAPHFRPGGPRFRLLFGEISEGPSRFPTPSDPSDLFGWGVIYALHSRACIERGRLWQAEHYVAAVRDHALALACLREGVIAVQARGYDDLSRETLTRFADTHIGALDAELLRTALSASVGALLDEATAAALPVAATVADRLTELR
jgi:hypothetical protein